MTHSNCRHFSKHHSLTNLMMYILYFHNRFLMPYTIYFRGKGKFKNVMEKVRIYVVYLKVQILIVLMLSEYKEENFCLRDFRFVNFALHSAMNGS